MKIINLYSLPFISAGSPHGSRFGSSVFTVSS